MPTSPECWALFSAMLQGQGERLFPDAYMAQHPDGDDPRQIQSVAVHVVALQSVLVSGQPRQRTSDVVRAAVMLGRNSGGYRVLQRPDIWPIDIGDVEARRHTASEYAAGVLAAWHETERDQIEAWTEATLNLLYTR